MNILKITFLIFLFSLSYEGRSQDKLQVLAKRKKGFKYEYKGYLYKEKQLPSLLKELGDNEASNLYREAIAHKGKVLVFGSLTGIGLLAAANLPESAIETPLSIIPLVVFFSTPFFAISEYRLYYKKRKQAIFIFNYNIESPPKIGVTPIDINLGFTTAGLGIRFSF